MSWRRRSRCRRLRRWRRSGDKKRRSRLAASPSTCRKSGERTNVAYWIETYDDDDVLETGPPRRSEEWTYGDRGVGVAAALTRGPLFPPSLLPSFPGVCRVCADCRRVDERASERATADKRVLAKKRHSFHFTRTAALSSVGSSRAEQGRAE